MRIAMFALLSGAEGRTSVGWASLQLHPENWKLIGKVSAEESLSPSFSLSPEEAAFCNHRREAGLYIIILNGQLTILMRGGEEEDEIAKISRN